MVSKSNTVWAKQCAQVLIDNMKPEEILYIIEKKTVFTFFPPVSGKRNTIGYMGMSMIHAENKANEVLNGYYSSLIHDQLKILLTSKSKQHGSHQ